MIDINKITVGERLIWLGSNADNSYGNRSVPAQVLEIKLPDRVKIKVTTPNGDMIKHVSYKSLDYVK